MARRDDSDAQGKSLFDYLVEQRAPLAEVPLNDVDATVLSYASYFYFDQGVLGRLRPEERVPVPMAICGVSRASLFGASTLMRLDGDTFLTAFLQSPRFMEMEVGRFTDELSPAREKQFAAVTFYLPDGSAFISYRGSDNSVAGWKEDFNLSYMKAVPSQLSAREYLEAVANSSDGALYACGHSKGGNLAEYASLTCRDETYERIARIWSLDGPGFANNPSERISTSEYAARLHKVIPESSVFGMMMEGRPTSRLRVVRSSGKLFAQHVPSKWLVENNDFVTVGQLTPDADIIASTVNKWAASYEPEQRELFFDVIFDVLRQGNGVYWSDKDGLESAIAIIQAASQVPTEIRRTVIRMMRDVVSVLSDETKRKTREATIPPAVKAAKSQVANN